MLNTGCGSHELNPDDGGEEAEEAEEEEEVVEAWEVLSIARTRLRVEFAGAGLLLPARAP